MADRQQRAVADLIRDAGLRPGGEHVQQFANAGAPAMDLSRMSEEEADNCTRLIVAVGIGGPYNINRRAATNVIYDDTVVLAADESIRTRYGAVSNGVW